MEDDSDIHSDNGISGHYRYSATVLYTNQSEMRLDSRVMEPWYSSQRLVNRLIIDYASSIFFGTFGHKEPMINHILKRALLRHIQDHHKHS